jgi:hypothetical protein
MTQSEYQAGYKQGVADTEVKYAENWKEIVFQRATMEALVAAGNRTLGDIALIVMNAPNCLPVLEACQHLRTVITAYEAGNNATHP